MLAPSPHLGRTISRVSFENDTSVIRVVVRFDDGNSLEVNLPMLDLANIREAFPKLFEREDAQG